MEDTDPFSTPLTDGADAFEAGELLSGNPYHPSLEYMAWCDWRDGWLTAQQEASAPTLGELLGLGGEA